MQKDDMSRILNEIGKVLLNEADFSEEGTLFFARMEEGMYSFSLFYTTGNSIIYAQPKYQKYQDLVLQLWEGMEKEHEWRELHFVMHGSNFKATFMYADEVDDDGSWSDQRDEAIQRHLGDKPVIYSPWDENDFSEL